MNEIDRLRARVRDMDSEIVRLIARRLSLTREIGRMKRDSGISP